ncbi:hypothetical protein QN277_027659 [Acacia crassicarpa]|uniref:Plant heme peroxidase family profile domain-containing protein n=1 Tax=Acacia crassicarpa TaxID=499986 RepID=A0AAE1J4W0_9FABA|nr:hypothetical protein QN277_027659 [Acacia crassicarpa]
MAPPQVDYAYGKQIESARQQLNELISKDKRYYAPLMLHLALHDAGIYGFMTDGAKDYLMKRGPNGSIGTQAELSHPSNKGLKKAVEHCDEVKRNNKKITYADLYQLAGVVAVQNTGGPPIEFVPGREDSTKFPDKAPLKSNELDESILEKIRERMDLEKKDMVALFGGLHQWSLPPDETPKGKQQNLPELKFDNSYFIGLKTREKQNLFVKDNEQYGQWVDTYEKDNNAFLADYAAAHKKVSELGISVAGEQTDQRTPAPGMSVAGKQTDQKTPAPGMSVAGKQTDQKTPAPSRNRVRLVQGIGIAVVTTAIILGFFLSRRSK